ncbi:diacylglycerol/lipid kinase family protein [Natronosalvus vescus]|uniref:diacylglycerol/lipid kinase family protein n=1 Tax=Natronosalvus vescus TaxID=2953881 RepID=UPI0020910752|nr:diacylglycerol kinase family protein [Natronosalvus vescus]
MVSHQAGERAIRSDGSGSSSEPKPESESKPAPDSVVICNPTSGSEDHLERVHLLAANHGWPIRVTETAGDAREFAREAAEGGLTRVVAVGGDGTVNEVVDGLLSAAVDGWPTLVIAPAGTGNNTASNLGIESVEDAFRLAEDGERRQIDLGVANGRAFINSCIGGLTAEASLETSAASKRRLGILAYVVKTIETAATFDPPTLRVTLEDDDASTAAIWEGAVALAFVGNCRRFTAGRAAQAHAEDGLLEVTLVENGSTPAVLGDAALEQLFDRDAAHIVHHRVPTVTLERVGQKPITYSLDGEVLETDQLTLETVPASVPVVVGEGYRPDPDVSMGDESSELEGGS